MFFRLWRQGAADPTALNPGIRRAAARQRTPRLRPRLEALEDRTLLSLNFSSAQNLDTYAWVILHSSDPLLPLSPIPKDLGDVPSTLQFNWNQGRSPNAVAIGDFNGDGIPDIAVADFNAGAQGKISVILGDGSGAGTFKHTQPVVDLTSSPQTIRLLDSGGFAPNGLVAARLRGPNAPLDLIVVNRGDDFGFGANVSVLLGNGDGNFQAPKSFDAGFFPTAVAVGDFQEDGNLDLVVANRTIFPGRATVLFGDGAGSFSAAQSLGLFDASQFPESVAVGDFNGDGHLDFVTANSSSNNVTVVLGNGDGSFKSAITYGTGTGPVSVAVADMNGDNKLDIITANNGGNDVSILLGNGDGTFPSNAPVNFSAGLTPTSVVVGNFDGAGPGVAVTNGEDSDTGSNSVSVLRFNPNHLPDNSDLLFAPTSFRAGEHPVALAAAQLRPGMPGVLDLVVANFGSTLDRGSVSVFLNDSHASFPTPGSFPTGLQPVSVAVGDFNGDGLTDFVAANNGTNDLSVWLNDGSDPRGPGFNFLPLTDMGGNPITLNTLGVNPKKVIVADVNGDGLPDIIVADFGDFGALQGNVTIFLNTGNKDHPFLNDPSFFHFQFAVENAYLLDMATGDFNGNGKLDVALLFFNANTLRFGVAILFGDGNGGLTLGPDTLLPVGTNPTSLAVGDFNGDGKNDVVVSNFQEIDIPGRSQPTLWVLFGNGDGKFDDPVGYHAGTHAQFVAVGNLRGDSRVDIIVANKNFPGGVTVFLNNGDGTFPEQGTPYFAGTNPVSIVVADLDGDGVLDIAVTNINGDSVSVLFGHPDPADTTHGDGTFMDTVAYVTGGFPTSIAAGDFFHHADGRLDLITTDSAPNDVSILQNIGPSPTPPPGPGGAAAPYSGQQSTSGGLAASELDQWFLLLGVADPELAAQVKQSDARTILDPWHPVARRPRWDDGTVFATLLGEEIEQY